LDIIPLGADKVFILCVSNSNVTKVIDEAHDFFNLFFSQSDHWNKDIVKFERGAWVRIYGIPIHTWNEAFFKLSVFYCGRFLRFDHVADLVNNLAEDWVDDDNEVQRNSILKVPSGAKEPVCKVLSDSASLLQVEPERVVVGVSP